MDILSAGDFTPDLCLRLFARAAAYEAGEAPGALSGRTVIQVFFEPSTRTQISFELAARRLNAQVLNMPVRDSSLNKGESPADTLAVLDGYRPDALVLRHGASGAAHFAAQILRCPVINAGDGRHEHPTQALTDAFVLHECFGRVAGLIVTIVGDVLHSRVARSNLLLLTRLGAKVRLVGPPELMPPPEHVPEAEIHEHLHTALRGADAVMCLRLQRERGACADQRAYFVDARALGNAAVLHPGPVCRDVEICGTLADDPERSLIRRQSVAALFVRAAVLEHAMS